MATFLETPRFPTNINYGVVGGPKYKTHIIEKNSGWENANIIWPQGRHEYDVVYAVKDQATIETLLAFFHAVKGRGTGFRFKDFTDYKSCGVNNTPSFIDQPLVGVTNGINRNFQLTKTYVTGANSTSRTIKKPVAGTVIVAVNSLQKTSFSLNTTTGIVTFDPNLTNTITAATRSNPCVLTANNSITPGETIYISGIVGMTALNNHRYRVLSRTSTTLTIDVDSSAFGNYVSGGVYHTIPQPGEVVSAGFEFDVPVRFANDDLQISIDNYKTRTVQNLGLIEIRV